MAEAEQEAAAQPAKSAELNSFRDILLALAGQVVTCSNPESYEDAPVGQAIKAGVYKAKIAAVKDDYITLVTEFKRVKGQTDKEAVKQFIPLSSIKRVSVMKTEKVLHL